jgi:hypothetical protein
MIFFETKMKIEHKNSSYLKNNTRKRKLCTPYNPLYVIAQKELNTQQKHNRVQGSLQSLLSFY